MTIVCRVFFFKLLFTYLFLSHNNVCFQCNVAVTNILVSDTCEIKFHDVRDRITVHMYSYAKILKHG